MEFLVASAIGVMTAAGIYLVLRARTFPVVIGLSLLTYATNLFLFATGRLEINRPPGISAGAAGDIGAEGGEGDLALINLTLNQNVAGFDAIERHRARAHLDLRRFPQHIACLRRPRADAASDALRAERPAGFRTIEGHIAQH